MIYGMLRVGRMAARSGGRQPKPANYTWGWPARLIWIALIIGVWCEMNWRSFVITLIVLVLLTVFLGALGAAQRGRRDTWARDQLPAMRAAREKAQGRRDRLDGH